MAVLGSNRPHGAITDMRIRLMEDRDRIVAELAKDIWTPEQRISLVRELNFANAELVKMQILSSKKWKRRKDNLRINKKNKMGRPKRMHDSQGQPLYNGVEPLPKPGEPTEDPKLKFLSTLKPDETSTQ